MSPERVGDRPRAQHETRSPAQITALVMGVWWTTNGIGAFFLDPNLTTSHVSGGGDLFGVAITVNGWHALFHLIPGLLGIVAARRASPALAFTLAAGTLYVVVGVWGLLAGGSSFGVIAVDASGDVVHVVEGLLTLTGGIVTLATRATVRRWE
jgi:hypothetical protein